jgi:hypothetical protein
MSSISTLEVAWEHYPWGTYNHELEEEMDEPYFCWIALQMSVLSMSGRVQKLPETVISRYSNTYAKKSKLLGFGQLPHGRLKMVISTYLNILLSVSTINFTYLRVGGRPRTVT